MIRPRNYSFVLLLLGLFAFHSVSADEPQTLEITSQGFSADQLQEGVVGEFPRLRVRIEASGRIKELTVKERSYEVDLAKTRDKYNLQLFGLDQTPRSYPDITLNLQNYINEKINKAGEYEFHILVTDRNDSTVEKKIFIDIHEALDETKSGIYKDAGSLQTKPFTLQRIGTGSVKGFTQLGIGWKTIDNTKVMIRIKKSVASNAQLFMLDKLDFDTIHSIDQLIEKLAGTEKTEAIVLTTTSNKSAGEVFSSCHNDKCYLLKIMKSSAYPSETGTIVTIEGYYKYLETDKQE